MAQPVPDTCIAILAHILSGLGSCITLLVEDTLVMPQFKWYGLFNKPFIFHLHTFMPRILQINFSQHEKSQGTYLEY